MDFIEVGDRKIKLNKSAIEKLPKVFPINEEELKVSFSREELLNFVTIINKLKDMLKMEVKKIEGMTHVLLDALYEIYPNIEIEELEETKRMIKKEIDESNMKQFLVAFVNKWNKIYSKFFSCHSTLYYLNYYLNLIFSPHSVNSRYPQNDINPLEIYNDKMPLIEQLSTFIKIADETLEDLTIIYTLAQDEKLMFKQY